MENFESQENSVESSESNEAMELRDDILDKEEGLREELSPEGEELLGSIQAVTGIAYESSQEENN